MPKITFRLSEKSIQAAIKELEAYRKRIEESPREIVQELADLGVSEIDANLPSEIDGNERGTVTATVTDTETTAHGTVNHQGSQVSYIEFGTGVLGRNNPYEKAAELGIEYLKGSKIHLDSPNPWWAYQKNGKFYVTHGIPPQNQVLNAAKTMRTQLKEIVQKVVKRK